jgi:hypothetical protein
MLTLEQAFLVKLYNAVHSAGFQWPFVAVAMAGLHSGGL